ncbi:protein E2 [BeAn 58058 virus]|uniref:protein E2 n=1 Tax=BeAn 58058 virus TaxID=67082 RepID=UPI00090CA9A0|nr:protein E2 [BeAn 58058 virus]APG58243.1 protein E2 [BeAn 58058 virus]
MFTISPLYEIFIYTNNKNLTKLYNQINKNDILNLILSGIYPPKLSQKIYNEVIEVLPEFIYLFKPKHVKLIDLLSIINSKNNLELYSNHINFYKYDILVKCSKFIIKKCINYMDILDDDIHIIKNRFYNIDDILHCIDYKSITNINYIFSNEIVEKILTNDNLAYRTLYNNQIFDKVFFN